MTPFFDVNVVFELSQKIGFDNNIFLGKCFHLFSKPASLLHRQGYGFLFKVFNPDF